MLRDRLVVTHHMVRLCWGGPLIKQVRPASSAGDKPAGACHLWLFCDTAVASARNGKIEHLILGTDTAAACLYQAGQGARPAQ